MALLPPGSCAHRHVRLLSARRDGPCNGSRAAEQRDELAPLPTERSLVGPKAWARPGRSTLCASAVRISLRLAVALAWPAKPVGVAQPATRRRRAGTPLVLVACSRARHAA